MIKWNIICMYVHKLCIHIILWLTFRFAVFIKKITTNNNVSLKLTVHTKLSTEWNLHPLYTHMYKSHNSYVHIHQSVKHMLYILHHSFLYVQYQLAAYVHSFVVKLCISKNFIVIFLLCLCLIISCILTA